MSKSFSLQTALPLNDLSIYYCGVLLPLALESLKRRKTDHHSRVPLYKNIDKLGRSHRESPRAYEARRNYGEN
jgi:hypothetical protein